MRLAVKTAGLEIGGEAEVMEVTKATRNALSHLEETVNGFDRGIRQAGFQVGQDAVEMFFESSRELAEGSSRERSAQPSHQRMESRSPSANTPWRASRKAMARPRIG